MPVSFGGFCELGERPAVAFRRPEGAVCVSPARKSRVLMWWIFEPAERAALVAAAGCDDDTPTVG